MSDPADSTIHGATDGGVAGTHPQRSPLRVLAGAATDGQFNTIQSAIFPIACFKLENVRFHFDSSLIVPMAARELPMLKSLIDQHSETDSRGKIKRAPPLSIFGHADPVGSDDYNKSLSGRRAAAFYGMLTRNTDVWADLYDNSGIFTSTGAIGDKWGITAIQIMLNWVVFKFDSGGSTSNSPSASNDSSGGSTPSAAVPLAVDGQMGPKTQAAVKQFQSSADGKSAGLSADGDPGPATRKALFLAYMNKVCLDGSEKPFQVDPKTGFLGQNGDSSGKADFQGCSEFNPVLLFSNADLQKYASDKDKTARDGANEVNRRVMALLFRPGAKVTPSLWPCPAAREGVDGCIKRFWSDGQQRRRNGDKQREFPETHDTFACRFYQRQVSHSPCETRLRRIRIRLFDPKANPIAAAPYLIEAGDRQVRGIADTLADAYVHDVLVPLTCMVHWSEPLQRSQDAPQNPDDFRFHLDVYVTIDEPGAISMSDSSNTGPDAVEGGGSPDAEAARKRLSNMGYSANSTLESNVKHFQRDLGMPEEQITGRLEDVDTVLKTRHDDLNPPKRGTRSGS